MLVLGAAAALVHLRRASRVDERLVAAGSFWRAVDVAGDTLLPREGGSLTLLPGQALLVEASQRARLAALSVAVQPLGSQAALQVESDGWLLTITPGEATGVRLQRAVAGAEPLTSTAGGPASSAAPLAVELRWS
ncbi:MAG TPA: hypothetical protein VFD43_05165, partial [Planctomycetota bacterium]|nr:hypothetical protein [Planctomycetota bacterium]